MLKSIKWYILTLAGMISCSIRKKGERTLEYYQFKSLYTLADRLAQSGYIQGSGLIVKTLEWLYHSSVTANNLAAFYEEYGKNNLFLSSRQDSRSVEKDIIKYYRLSNKRRSNVKANCSLGYISYKKKMYDHAVGYYRRALKLKKRAELYYNVAIMYFYMGKYSQAIQYIHKAIPGLRRDYQKEACLALIYIYAVNGYKELARTHFRKYIDTYEEWDIDLIYVAYVCEDYGYIDRHCFAFSQEEEFTLEDAELVVRVLCMVGKEKLAKYFFNKWLDKRVNLEDEQWLNYCKEAYQEVVEQVREEYVPLMKVDPILHKKYYLR